MFTKVKETVLESLAKFQRQGSNWRFRSVLSLDLHTVKYEPLSKFLAAKKAIINFKNQDDECFKWTVTRALNPLGKHWMYWSKTSRNIKGSQWEGLKFPVNLSDINKFENHNSSFPLNVFGYGNLVYPLRIRKHKYKRESTANLLLISDDTNQHYCWIKNISKLLSLQTSKHDHARHVCLDVLIHSIPRNHEHLIMSIVNHTKLKKFYFPKRDRKYILKIKNGQCESHLLYMHILNPSHHSYQHANQTLRRATPSSIRNTSSVDFVTT